MPNLLICSVGGTLEPIVASIRHHQPDRLILWHTANTKASADQAVHDSNITEGAVDFRIVRDAQDFPSCVIDARKLRSDYDQWRSRSESHQVVVDFTGGTKLMSAALALVTHRWICRFSYVGGTRRTKQGVGVVEQDAETTLCSDNPLDALAYQPVHDAVQLFNAGLPAAARKLLRPVTNRPDLDPAIKRSVAALIHVLDAYAKWDAFQHHDAANSFAQALKNLNDLLAILPDPASNLKTTLQAHQQLCQRIHHDATTPTTLILADLLANAQRRANLGQYDDAVARLYRAIEAFAQIKLAMRNIDTSDVQPDQIPPSIRDNLQATPRNGFCKLGLQDAYKLLQALDPSSAQSFFDKRLDAPTSPLTARNQSILAHGFQPVTIDTYRKLQDVVSALLEMTDQNQFAFPSLPSP